jgi:transglutaminase-like putative cysteine protease
MKMKKFLAATLVAILMAATITPALAIGRTATATTQNFTFNGAPVMIKSYNINEAGGDVNFISIRDLCIVFDVSITYASNPESIYIDTTQPYLEDKTTILTDPYPPETITELSTATIYVNGRWQLMPAHKILNRTYVRLRDGVRHLGGMINYDEATNTAHLYSAGNAPAPTPIPGQEPTWIGSDGRVHHYTPTFFNDPTNPFPFRAADEAIQPLIDQFDASGLSDREKLIEGANFIRQRITYDRTRFSGRAGSVTNVYTTNMQLIGVCGSFAEVYRYFCYKIGIPAITASGDNHAWNEVYLDGQWFVFDVTNYYVGTPASEYVWNGSGWTVTFREATHPRWYDDSNKSWMFVPSEQFWIANENPQRTAERREIALQIFGQ